MRKFQRTISKRVSCSGNGLHSGKPAVLSFCPAEPGTGVRFVRVDLDPPTAIEADITNAVDADKALRRTTLQLNGTEVSTVEHVLAAVAGLEIDNLLIEIDGEEAVEPDGSAAPFVELLRSAGIVEQPGVKRYFKLTNPVSVVRDGAEIMAIPHDGFRISFTIEFDHPAIGTQHASFEMSEDVFCREIAPARTFSLLKDVEELRKHGLIKGGSLDNAVVVGDNGVMNEDPLRFQDEFVRHKILDLMGDLFLLGMPLQAQVISYKSGHAGNVQLVKKLREAAEKELGPTLKLRNRAVVPSTMDIAAVQKIMPHRYPFLLVDKIVHMESGKRVVGIKNVTINEPFFAGHFPGHPIMPAVLIIEAMAQVGGVLLLSSVDDTSDKLVYFMGIDNARFRKPVLPGDQLRFELELLRLKKRSCKMKGEAFVDGDLVAEAELLSMIITR